MTRRRWIADQWDESTASMRGQQAEHLIRVLRAEKGMVFDVIAGGKVWRAAIAGISGDEVLFRLLAEVESAPALPITLLVSIFKFDRMEWVIEKATELGVERLAPMIARRSEKHLVQSAPARVERWRRIARESARQSRRSDVPVIDEVVPLKSAARSQYGAVEGIALRLLLAEQEQSLTLLSALQGTPGRNKSLAMAIGPEGGWAAEEEALFVSEGWTAVSLGPRILRVETAAISAVALAAALL